MKPLILVVLVLCPAVAEELKMSSRAGQRGSGKRTTSAEETQEAQFVSSPITGYTVLPSSEVRAILGVPGATHYSDPLRLPDDAQTIRAVPGHRWLLVLREEGGASVWVPENGTEDPLAGAFGRPELVGFSSHGTAAALFSRASSKVTLYTGLPDTPRMTAEHPTLGWPEDLSTLCVSSDGRLVAGSTTSGRAYLLATPDGATGRLLVDDVFVSSLMFWGDSENLVMLDGNGSRVLSIDDPIQGTGARELAVMAPGVFGPLASLAMAEGNSLLVLDGSSGNIVLIDALSPGVVIGEPRSHRVEPFLEASRIRGRGALLLSKDPGAASRIVMADDAMRIYYVPPVPPSMPLLDPGAARDAAGGSSK